MSDNGAKTEDDHVNIHDEGGDDEVRAGFLLVLPRPSVISLSQSVDFRSNEPSLIGGKDTVKENVIVD